MEPKACPDCGFPMNTEQTRAVQRVIYKEGVEDSEGKTTVQETSPTPASASAPCRRDRWVLSAGGLLALALISIAIGRTRKTSEHGP